MNTTHLNSNLNTARFQNNLSNTASPEREASSTIEMGRNVPRSVGVTLGVLALAGFSDPFAALVLCLTTWMALLLLRWPLKVMAAHGIQFGVRLQLESKIHMWLTILVLFVVVLTERSLGGQLQFWLLVSAVGYHLLTTQMASRSLRFTQETSPVAS